MIPSRPPDSEPRLAAEAQALIGQPFVWGRTDCALVCLRLLDAMLFSGYAEEYAGLWSDEGSARAWLLANHSFAGGLAEAGAESVAPAFAQPGDILTAENWYAYACLGARCITAAPERGVFVLPTAAVIAHHGDALSCWRL